MQCVQTCSSRVCNINLYTVMQCVQTCSRRVRKISRTIAGSSTSRYLSTATFNEVVGQSVRQLADALED